jgi:hypothetical protein
MCTCARGGAAVGRRACVKVPVRTTELGSGGTHLACHAHQRIIRSRRRQRAEATVAVLVLVIFGGGPVVGRDGQDAEVAKVDSRLSGTPLAREDHVALWQSVLRRADGKTRPGRQARASPLPFVRGRFAGSACHQAPHLLYRRLGVRRDGEALVGFLAPLRLSCFLAPLLPAPLRGGVGALRRVGVASLLQLATVAQLARGVGSCDGKHVAITALAGLRLRGLGGRRGAWWCALRRRGGRRGGLWRAFAGLRLRGLGLRRGGRRGGLWRALRRRGLRRRGGRCGMELCALACLSDGQLIGLLGAHRFELRAQLFVLCPQCIPLLDDIAIG